MPAGIGKTSANFVAFQFEDHTSWPFAVNPLSREIKQEKVQLKELSECFLVLVFIKVIRFIYFSFFFFVKKLFFSIIVMKISTGAKMSKEHFQKIHFIGTSFNVRLYLFRTV